MAFLKPQSPLQKDNDYFYPLTTMDQIIVDENYRMNDLVGRIQKSTFTLYSNKWSSSYPYTQSISINGLSDDKNFKFYPKYPNDIESKKQIKNEYNKIDFTSNSGNVLTFECWDDIPDINIEMVIEISMIYPLEGTISDKTKEEIDEKLKKLPTINYSIIGGTTEPANPTENMIWVNTDEEITGYIFSKNEPINKKQGLIWFRTGENSNVSFHSLTINNITFDEIYPMSSYQYLGEEWVNITSLSYQTNKWVDWFTYLFMSNAGAFTQMELWNYSGTTMINRTGEYIGKDKIIFTGGSTASYGEHSLYTTNTINLTDIDVIYCKVKRITAPSSILRLYITNATAAKTEDFKTFVAAAQDIPITNEPQIYTLDVSSFAGNYRIGFGGYGTCEIYDIWY